MLLRRQPIIDVRKKYLKPGSEKILGAVAAQEKSER